jgi:hypothetical protein
VAFPTFGGLISPGVPSVDAAGNVAFASTVGTTSIFFGTTYAPVRVSPQGAALSGFFIDTAPGIQTASDASGNTWIAHTTGGQVTELPCPGSSSNEAQYTFNGNSNDDGHQLAIDTPGNVYISDYTNQTTYGLTNSGSLRGSTNFGGSATGIALLTNSQFLFIYVGTNIDSGNTSNFGLSNYPCTNFGCYAGGFAAPSAFAVPSNGYLWTLNYNSTLSGFDTTGATNRTTGGYLNGSPFRVAA